MSNRSIFFQLKLVLLPKYIFSRDIFAAEIDFQLRCIFRTKIYFQPRYIFGRDIFSTEIYFQSKYMSSRKISPTEKNVERKIFPTEKYFQPKDIFNRNIFSTEVFQLCIPDAFANTDKPVHCR